MLGHMQVALGCSMTSSSPFLAESLREACAGLVVVWCGLACGGATARAPTPDAARSGASAPGPSSATAGALGVDALPPPPEELYGELFIAVQSARVFEDQKAFVDAWPSL